jgi:uncharacterized membrane protein YdjX (TVP38/TMEM64 family)
MGLILFFLLNGSNYLSLDNVSKSYNQISAFILEHKIKAVLIFMLVYISTVFFSIPIKPLLKMFAGLFFGLAIGFVTSLLSATVGAMLAFLLVKHSWGSGSDKSKFKIVNKFSGLMETHPIYLLFVSRLLPIPFFVPNILAGIYKVKNSIFLVTTFLGIIPVTFIYVWFGTHIRKTIEVGGDVNVFFDTKFMLAVGFLAVLALLPLLIKLLSRKK